MAEVVFASVTRSIDGRPILDDIDLTVPDGALMAIIGPSGSGKTSLLRVVCGLDRPDRGRVTVDGRDVAAGAHGVAMVFQGAALYEHLDVGGNLRFPLEVGGADAAAIESIPRDRARRLGITRLWSRRPPTLSGGERGMVAAARAISREGLRVLLLDEPLWGADGHVRRRFRLALRRLHDSEGLTTILATNDQEEAIAVADLIAVVMDGRVVQVGSPRELLDRPVSAAVAGFVGPLPMNLFPGVVRDGFVEVGSDRLGLPVPLDDGMRVLWGVHPHDLTPAGPSTPFARIIHGTVGRVEDLGATSTILFGLGRSPAGPFRMVVPGRAVLAPGDRLAVTWDPDRARLFRSADGVAIPGQR